MNDAFAELSEKPYPPIGDYGYISDCHSAALVSRAGSIDWCCMPRLDSGSIFGRLLDWEKGGHCRIAPTAPARCARRYLEGSLILETIYRTEGGEVRLLDFFTMRKKGEHHPHRQILRLVEGVRGKVEMTLEIAPRFDYGAIRPWLRDRGDHFLAIGGTDGLLISGDLDLAMQGRHRLAGRFTLREGERRHLSLLHRKPEALDEGLVEVPAIEELDRRFAQTRQWWRTWSDDGGLPGAYGELSRRSAIVLKGLSNAPTGAIAAAATTSLPESPGGSRNWDYRYSWIRDSYFTVRSLAELGYASEADGFRRFVERSTAGSAEELQILFGVGGERRLLEREIDELCGYRGASPVRVGNAAEGQRQLDVYGELLDLAWIWHRRGCSPDDDYWEFLCELVNAAARLWAGPDQGIWEMRGAPRHFVQSKAMCWVALDRGIRLAEELGRQAPLEAWRAARRSVREAVETHGYDRKRGVFIQAFERPVMDAALLLLPVAGFVDYRDERMVRTVAAVRAELEEEGLLRRYGSGDDQLDGEEGVFLPCTFWLAECLARQGDTAGARRVFERGVATGNDLGLFAEEYDLRSGQMLGNFPQGLTHLSLIAAAVAIAEAEKGA